MTQLNRRALLLALTSMAFAHTAGAAQSRYFLDKPASRVGFQFSLNGIAQSGSMPVKTADIRIDLQNLAASRVDVTLDVQKAKTGLIFATQALTSPEVLDAQQFPTIRFVSRSIKLAQDGRLSGGARITGDLTMRGVTRQISLNANLYRRRGSSTDDLSKLTVRLDGQVSRSAFDASGFADLVDDIVTLDITAAIQAKG